METTIHGPLGDNGWAARFQRTWSQLQYWYVMGNVRIGTDFTAAQREELNRRMRLELIHRQFATCLSYAMLQFCCLFLTPLGKDFPALCWVSAMFHLLAGIARFGLGKRFVNSGGLDMASFCLSRKLTFTVLVAWCAFCAFALRTYDLTQGSIYVLLGLVAMLFGAAAALSPDLTVGLPFVLICVTPIWYWGLELSATGAHAMLVSGTIGLIGVLSMQVRLHQTLVEGNIALLQFERQAQEMKAAKESAEEATLAKSMFLANISHEIRTPLSGVIGLTNLLAETTLGAWQQELVSNVQSSGELLLALVNDVLDFSKISAWQLEIAQAEFDLRTTLREAIGAFQTIGAKKMVAVGLEVSPNVPDWVTGDAVRIRQVLSNLLGNSIKFTAAGSITLTVGNEPALGEAPPRVRFQVTDTGIGISAEAIDRLFREFSQADGSTTRRFGGTGLGLAISKRLVELMGGEIGVVSTPGEGSTFWFTLPLVPAAAPSKAAVLPNPSVDVVHRATIGLNILIAEDNPVNQTILRSMVSKMGHRCQVVGNGRLAYEAVQTQNFDMVLMDWQMPEMDALEATAAIRKLGSRGQLPIIAVTANAFKEDRERCLAGGMSDHVSKPVRRNELQQAIELWAPAKPPKSPQAATRDISPTAAAMRPATVSTDPMPSTK